MSYILDALKKAAEQRDRHAPALKRLLGPAPTRRSVWARSPSRLLAVLLLNAGLLIVLLLIWLRPVPIAAPPESVPAVTTSHPQQSSALAPQRAPEPPRLKLPKTPAVTPPQSAAPPAVPGTPAPMAAAPLASPRPAAPGLPPAAPGTPAAPAQGTPAPTVTPPAPPAAAPTSPSLAGLRLEALIYSDVPEKRMIFVNGRKYVEGDTIEGRLRVDEIQEDGVALSEQGHRMTLRIAR